MNDFQTEQRNWSIEVDEEAAKLVRQGTPPYEAVNRARDTVSARRRQAAWNRSLERRHE